MADFLKEYNAIRARYERDVNELIGRVKHEAHYSWKPESKELHDYLNYLAAFLGAMGQGVGRHRAMSFERWRQEFCGARRACLPDRELEDY